MTPGSPSATAANVVMPKITSSVASARRTARRDDASSGSAGRPCSAAGGTRDRTSSKTLVPVLSMPTATMTATLLAYDALAKAEDGDARGALDDVASAS